MKPLSKIRESARGEECEARIPGICNFNPETTVLAHMNGAGMGMKASDHEAGYCCSDCHDAIDGRTITVFTCDEITIMFYECIFRTQKKLIEKGLMVIK